MLDIWPDKRKLVCFLALTVASTCLYVQHTEVRNLQFLSLTMSSAQRVVNNFSIIPHLLICICLTLHRSTAVMHTCIHQQCTSTSQSNEHVLNIQRGSCPSHKTPDDLAGFSRLLHHYLASTTQVKHFVGAFEYHPLLLTPFPISSL